MPAVTSLTPGSAEGAGASLAQKIGEGWSRLSQSDVFMFKAGACCCSLESQQACCLLLQHTAGRTDDPGRNVSTILLHTVAVQVSDALDAGFC